MRCFSKPWLMHVDPRQQNVLKFRGERKSRAFAQITYQNYFVGFLSFFLSFFIGKSHCHRSHLKPFESHFLLLHCYFITPPMCLCLHLLLEVCVCVLFFLCWLKEVRSIIAVCTYLNDLSDHPALPLLLISAYVQAGCWCDIKYLAGPKRMFH